VSRRHVFIADIHLRREQLVKRDALIRFISQLPAPEVHLYVLGDLFDVYVGEVQLEREPELRPVIEALGRFVRSGGKLTFFHGNRDYCMADYLTRRFGAETVYYSKIIDLDGKKTYLNHGDLLCTRDQLYQLARMVMRNRHLVKIFLHYFPTRLKFSIGQAYRGVSERRGSHRKERPGINRDKVRKLVRRGVELIICGHVHERLDRTYQEGRRQARLISLPLWQGQGGALEYADGSFTLRPIDFT